MAWLCFVAFSTSNVMLLEHALMERDLPQYSDVGLKDRNNYVTIELYISDQIPHSFLKLLMFTKNLKK
jgi:hypothetical protein